MKYKKYVNQALVTAAVAFASVALPAAAHAQTVNESVNASVGAHINPGGPMIPAGQGQHDRGPGGTMGVRPAVIGKVTAISGTSLTVVETAHAGFGSSTPAMGTTTYTVNGSTATVLKNNATSSISAIAVGDLVAVQGSVNGTNVTATSISDGFEIRTGPAGGQGGQNGFHHWNNASSSNNMPASPITGNGQPVIAGTISAISGTSLTITNKSNVTYTVNAASAKIVEGQNTVTVSSLAVGDSVIIQGSVSGTSVTASSVIDQKAGNGQGGQNGQSQASSTNGRPGPEHGGIFSAIGGFFGKLFGF